MCSTLKRNTSKIRCDTYGMYAIRWVLPVVITVLSVLLPAGTASAPPRDMTTGCDWNREYQRTLAYLDELSSDWHIIDMRVKRPGVCTRTPTT